MVQLRSSGSYNQSMGIDITLDKLIERKQALDHLITSIEKIMSSLPEGRLRIHTFKNTTTYYYIPPNDKGYGTLLSNNDKLLINSLAQKSYYRKVLRAAQEEKKLIDQFLKRFPEPNVEGVYMKLPEARRHLINPVTLPDEEYKQRWLQEAYEPMGFDEGDPYYLTQKGLRVRSKSEMLIAERLDAKGIPYKYEYPVELQYGTVHPDFKILRLSDRKELYYEHLGKMDDPAYAQKNVKKLREYALNGYTIGDNLFLTMETSVTPLDMRVVDKMIDEHFR